MQIIQQILFVLCAGVAGWLFAKKVKEIRRNIFLGRPESLNDNPRARWNNMLLLALGQKKMFKRPLPAIFHFFVYAGFILINIEVLEIIVDGTLGTTRAFAPFLGNFYSFVISFFEILGVLVLISVIIFFIRRNIYKIPRLNMKELEGFPRKDANAILYIEMVLMSMLLIMNAADTVIMQREGGTVHNFLISGMIAPAFEGFSTSALHIVERVCWWGHILGIFAFLNYLPYSKHFHIILAFPNAYYGRLDPQGKMKNMPEIQKEVLYMMQPELAPAEPQEGAPQRFGARDVQDLSWKSLLDAYACTECGRCTAVCPANQTGKLLSPRRIMMATRDRLEEVGNNITKNGSFVDDGKSLVHDYITVEELRACTTCQACVEACPVSIEPLSIIDQLRRYLIMEESNAPQEWNLMSSNIENNMAPWKFSPDERDQWAVEMNAES